MAFALAVTLPRAGDIAEATLAPRIHHQWLPEVLHVEEGLYLKF